jgi:HTH-type transcriptional regulator/antitoxin HipB
MKNQVKMNSIPDIQVKSATQLAAAIRRLRKLQGLSQIQLAKQTGITQAAISRIENSIDHVQVKTLFLILTALNTNLHIGARSKNKSKILLEGLY